MLEYVELAEPSIGLRFAQDIRGVLVNEYGYPDNLQTLGLAVLQHGLARLRVSSKATLRPPEEPEHEILWRRRGLVPKQLSFWVNTMLRNVGRERDVADAQFLFDQRLLEGRTTIFDR